MKKEILSKLVIIATIVIVISFFMPWAKVSTSVAGVTKGVTTTAKAKLGGIKAAEKLLGQIEKVGDVVTSAVGDVEVRVEVSGYDVPVLVNKNTSQIALALVEIFFKDAEGAGVKSYAVYLLPIFGIASAVLAVLGLKKKLYVIAMTVLGGAISIVGLFRLMTTNLANLVADISIGQGLWSTMYAFLAICIIGIVWIFKEKQA